MFRIAESFDDLVKASVVRGIVFLGEQHTSYAIEKDEHEQVAVHVLGEIDGEPVAAGRIRFLGEFAKLERLAVRKEWRGRGYGSRLIEFMMQTARDRGFGKVKLHAQLTTKGFYARHGFQATGDTFMEADIEHCLMVREE
jgi:predicted GNAT family N-acyltransferase